MQSELMAYINIAKSIGRYRWEYGNNICVFA